MTRVSPERCTLCHRWSGKDRCSFGVHVGSRLGADRASHRYRRGQLVFTADTPAHSVFVLRSGCVKVFRTSQGGEEQVLRLLGPGEILGYRPVLAGEAYAASAEAVEDSDLCIIPATTVHRVAREVPEFALGMMAKLAVELRLSEELMMDLIHRPVRQRAARLLLNLLAEGRHAPRPLRLQSRYLRRQDMARMIGTTPETFSRVLHGLSSKGLIEMTREYVDIVDETRLRQLAGSD